jgi:hypothetical protein
MAMEIAQIHGDDHPTARESECNGHRWKCGVLRDDSGEHYVRAGRAPDGVDFGLYDVETTSVIHCSVWVTPGLKLDCRVST